MIAMEILSIFALAAIAGVILRVDQALRQIDVTLHRSLAGIRHEGKSRL